MYPLLHLLKHSFPYYTNGGLHEVQSVALGPSQVKH